MSLRVSLIALSFLALAAAGCGAKRVPNDVLDKLPYESKIELLEAENDLALAMDHLDEAHSEVTRTYQAIQRAKDRRSSAKGEVGDAKDSKTVRAYSACSRASSPRPSCMRLSAILNEAMPTPS